MTSLQFLPNLDLNDRIYDKGNLIVVHQKGEIASDFLLHFLVCDFVKRYGDEARILLVLNHTSVNRWNLVSSRLGYNLQSLIEKKHATIIDLLRISYRAIINRFTKDSCHPQTDTGRNESIVNGESGEIDLVQLIDYCKQDLELLITTENSKYNSDTSRNRRVLVLVEDLSDLHLMNSTIFNELNPLDERKMKDRNISEFLRQLRSWSLNDSNGGDITLLTSVRSKNEDEISDRFSNTIAQVLGSIVFEVSPLSTGFSANVSGFLNVKCQQGIVCNQSSPMERHWSKNHHFKLEDRAIKITPL